MRRLFAIHSYIKLGCANWNSRDLNRLVPNMIIIQIDSLVVRKIKRWWEKQSRWLRYLICNNALRMTIWTCNCTYMYGCYKTEHGINGLCDFNSEWVNLFKAVYHRCIAMYDSDGQIWCKWSKLKPEFNVPAHRSSLLQITMVPHPVI